MDWGRWKNSAAGTAFIVSSLYWSPVRAQPTGRPLPEDIAPAAPDTGGMSDIIDIRPPLALDPDYSFLIWVIAAVLAAALIVAAVLYWRKRKAARQRIVPPPPPHETALLALDSLKAADGLTPREFYFELSQIMRGYLEGRYGLKALEMTTEELLPCLDGLGLPVSIKSDLKSFSRFSDPVKFAASSAADHQMRDHLDMIRAFVENTRPGLSQEPEDAQT